MRRDFACFLLLLSLSTSAISQTANGEVKNQGNSIDEMGIQKVLADQVEAWNRHDAKAFSMVFAEDADFTNVVGMSAHGRAEVEKFHAPMFATIFKDTNLKITKTKIRFIKPDVAAVDAWWEMTGAKTREGKEIPLRKGLLNFVMTKEGGTWFITVMHNMNLPVS
jgi:uncharacterized protein (TIGR02246 family)